MATKASKNNKSIVGGVSQRARRSVRFIDLFSGCGGLTAGAVSAIQEAGLKPAISLAIDNNRGAIEVYRQNFAQFGDVVCSSIDEYVDCSRAAKKLISHETRALDSIARVDLMLAGPPCQGHSNLNNSSRRSDPRNLLYWAPVRAAMHLRPKVILIENVPGVTHAQEGVIDGAREHFLRSGYCVAESTIELVALGVPQLRKRHVLVATLKPFDMAEFLLRSMRRGPNTVLQAIADLEDRAGISESPEFKTTKLSPDNVRRIDYLFDNDIFDLPNSMRPRCHRDKDHSYVSMYGRMHPNKPAQTITSGFGSMGQGRFVHPTRRRMITAREAARIQGFGDDFSFENVREVTSLREMIGNAVPPALSRVFVSEFIRAGHL
jgi:DNA-methyltransferase (dcm)